MKKIILLLLLVSSPVFASYQVLWVNELLYSGSIITTDNKQCFLHSPWDYIKNISLSWDVIATGNKVIVDLNRETDPRCLIKTITQYIEPVIQEPITEPIDPLFELFVAKRDEYMKNNEKSKWEKLAFKIIKRDAKNKLQKDVINYVLESMK